MFDFIFFKCQLFFQSGIYENFKSIGEFNCSTVLTFVRLLQDFFNLPAPLGVKWLLVVTVICIFLLTNDIEHLCMSFDHTTRHVGS